MLINIARDTALQDALRTELCQARQDYIEQQNTLLHYVALESLRVSPAMSKSARVLIYHPPSLPD
jgi:hypothetical protein